MQPMKEQMKKAGIQPLADMHYGGCPVYWGDYRSQKSQKNIVGRYCFIESSYDFWREKIFQNEEFVTEVIEPVFYELRDDLRWNLYLVCVFSGEEFEKIPLEEYLEFEQNREYTRNMLVCEEEFEDLIPSGKVSGQRDGGEIPDPVKDWQAILEKKHLEFCLESYSWNVLNSYIEGTEQKGRKPGKEKNCRNGVRVREITDIYLDGRYRENCFGRKCVFPLSRVNLLDGRNGAGKTSVLDAVELSLTGSVRKTKTQTQGEREEGTSLMIHDGRQQCELKAPNDTQEEKKRENEWYQSRKTSRGSAALNRMFHTYNYFTAEDTFLFAFSGEQPDYRENFSNLLFGEESRQAEHAWKKYREEADKGLKRNQSDQKAVKEQLFRIRQEEAGEISGLGEYWNHTGFSGDYGSSTEEIQHITAAFLSAYDQAEGQKPIATPEEAKEQLSMLQMPGNEEKWKLEVKGAEEREQELRGKLEESIALRNQKRRTCLKGEEFERPLRLLRYVSGHRGEYRRYLKQREEMTLIEDELTEEYTVFYETYKDLVDLDETEQSLAEKIAGWDALNQSYQELLRQTEKGEEQLRQEKNRLDTLQTLKNDLQSAGRQYAERAEEISGCPLCGNPDATRESILRYLEEKSEENDAAYQSLRARNILLEEEKKRVKERLEEIERLRAQEELIQKAAKEYDPGASLSEIRDRLLRYAERRRYREQLLEQREELEQELLEGGQGITKEELSHLPYYADKIRRFLSGDQEETAKREPLEALADRLSLVLEQQKQDFKNSEREVVEYRLHLQEAEEKRERAEKEYQRWQNEYRLYREKKQNLEGALAFWEEVGPLLKSGQKQSAEVLCTQAERVQQLLRAEEKNQFWNESRRKLEKEKKKLENQKKRYETILTELDKLKPRESYAEEFIRENIHHISRIFLSLHSPREFDSLTLSRENELIAMRGEEEVPIYRLSTGQKTAVALAAFFQMNLNAVHGPNIIMLDEPVANIDDMNVLAMLDFLREMALTTERQIFFTTANFNVAKLFHRKFSCMEEDFQELSFERRDGMKSRVTRRKYDMERCVVKEEV